MPSFSCVKVVKMYVGGKLKDPLASVPSAHALRYCFEIMRDIILDNQAHIGEKDVCVCVCLFACIYIYIYIYMCVCVCENNFTDTCSISRRLARCCSAGRQEHRATQRTTSQVWRREVTLCSFLCGVPITLELLTSKHNHKNNNHTKKKSTNAQLGNGSSQAQQIRQSAC